MTQESDLKDFRAAVSLLKYDALSGAKRFRLLRQVWRLAMKCATSGANDPEVWRTLGEIELARHEKYVARRFAGVATNIWRPRIGSSFDKAAYYLNKAAKIGDTRALRQLGYLYSGVYSPIGSGIGKDRLRRSRALHYFRKAHRAGVEGMEYMIYGVLREAGRWNAAFAWLRRASRRGDATAMVELAELLYSGKRVVRDDTEVAGLLADAATAYDEIAHGPSLKSRIDFLQGLCLYYGRGLRRNRERGLALIEGAAGICLDAQLWLESGDRDGLATPHIPITPQFTLPPGDSPMRFFAPSWRAAHGYKRASVFAHSYLALKPQTMAEPAAPAVEKTEEEILRPLEALVGLPKIKEEIARIVHLGQVQKMRREEGLKEVPFSMHMAFLGAPGTGKTTTARLVGQILRDAGLLSIGHVVEVDRGMLVGQYIGQTEQLTRARLEKALGGVLFIDEAYALGNKDSARDYGNDAIELILKFMEDHRGEMAVIAAGYPEPMKIFFNANPGIRSRFAHLFEFPSITGGEAADLFREFCGEYQYELAEGVSESVDRHFAHLARQALLSESNGRGVRVLFEQMVARQSRRIVKNRLHDRKALTRIEPEDLPWDAPRSRLHVVEGTDG